jgi:hypothetical protein
MTKTQQEIVRLGYQALINSLGVVDSIRFIQYFSQGRGDYTKERHQWLDNTSLEELFQLMKQNPESENTQYDEIIS